MEIYKPGDIVCHVADNKLQFRMSSSTSGVCINKSTSGWEVNEELDLDGTYKSAASMFKLYKSGHITRNIYEELIAALDKKLGI